MSQEVIEQISGLLNEEKWTRATLTSYSINNFVELDKKMEQLDAASAEELKLFCDEHLEHSKNSIIALYLSGIIAMSRNLVDDSNLIHLISIFTDNHKMPIVEYLCERMLSFGENKFALRTLIACHIENKDEEKKLVIWKRLIKVDLLESDIVKSLAENCEENGNEEEAVYYYKKAILRYLNKKVFSSIKEVWAKLISLCSEDVEFFFLFEKKIAKSMGEDKAVTLLEEYFSDMPNKDNYDVSIEVLKNILFYDAKNDWARSEIIKAFKQKYKDHSQLEEYIRLSNLNQSWRSIQEAIADFEKHISFDAGNFVYHRTWGIGIIKSIIDDDITIDFTKKRNHAMSLKMAVNSLTFLSRNHIWVLKSIIPKDKLKARIKTDIPWALTTIIKSFDNVADMKKIKAELVPSLLSQGEWATWSTEARKILKTDSSFGNLPDKADQFVVRDKPISFEEKTFNKFKAETGFFKRVEVIQEFLTHSDADSEYFVEMLDFFKNYLKSFSVVNEQVISSYLLLKRLVKKYPYLDSSITYEFLDLYEDIESVENVFSNIDDPELKRDFLTMIKRNIPEWESLFISLFPIYMSRFIIDELNSIPGKESLSTLIQTIVDHYRENREPFIWVVRNISDDEWFKELGISEEKLLIGMIHLLDTTFRDIDNKKEVSLNRKLHRQIETFLIKEKRLVLFFQNCPRDSIFRVLNLVEDVKGLDPSIKIDLKRIISDRFPDFMFAGEEVEKVQSSKRRGVFALVSSFKAKQKELKNIINVEIPLNSKEIGAAIEMGDLKENAEYKAGKEKQEILNTTVGKLKEELDRAIIFNPENATKSSIAFGTIVSLKNMKNNEEEHFTILGPWESDPFNHIISYLSPFASALLGHKKGENVKFSVNERDFDYSILSIDLAEIE